VVLPLIETAVLPLIKAVVLPLIEAALVVFHFSHVAMHEMQTWQYIRHNVAMY
jgi:hypothetical protein